MTELRPVDFVVATLRRYAPRPDQVVVDVGCGPALYHDAAPGRYIGVDREPGTYGAAAVQVVTAPADALPLDDASADLVFTLSAFYAFDDHAGALAEFRRVLKPGGRVLLFDYNRRAQRRLEASEGASRPKWTALQLRRMVSAAGFASAEILPPRVEDIGGVKRWLLLAREELLGQWAIVTATRP